MKITESGRTKIASEEFAVEITRLARQWDEEGISREECKRLLVAHAVLVLCSREHGPLPTPDELTTFMEMHAIEIDVAADLLLRKLTNYGGSIH